MHPFLALLRAPPPAYSCLLLARLLTLQLPHSSPSPPPPPPPSPPACSNTSAKFYGEITQQMLKNASFPGSNNGTGLFQTIVGLKVGGQRPWEGRCSFSVHGLRLLCMAVWPLCGCSPMRLPCVNSCLPASSFGSQIWLSLCLSTLPSSAQVREVYERITEKEVVPV